jgi:hypothetical protein
MTYRVELDVDLILIPPMDEEGGGITMTRSFEIPFPPVEGLPVFSSAWEVLPEPVGFPLTGVVWDLDRQTFLADNKRVQYQAIAAIPEELSHWVARGWRLGSYYEHYTRTKKPAPPGPMAKDAFHLSAAIDDVETYEILHTLPPEKRPAAFNALMKALVRHLSDSGHNCETAFAMDKTGRYLGSEGEQVQDEKAHKAWNECCREYDAMSADDKTRWKRKVGKYPALSTFVYISDDIALPHVVW